MPEIDPPSTTNAMTECPLECTLEGSPYLATLASDSNAFRAAPATTLLFCAPRIARENEPVPPLRRRQRSLSAAVGMTKKTRFQKWVRAQLTALHRFYRIFLIINGYAQGAVIRVLQKPIASRPLASAATNPGNSVVFAARQVATEVFGYLFRFISSTAPIQL